MAKRERERARLARQENKRSRRQEVLDAATTGDGPSEESLWDEFRILSERFSRGEVSEADYTQERQRIHQELGIEDPGA